MLPRPLFIVKIRHSGKDETLQGGDAMPIYRDYKAVNLLFSRFR
jgi:hypothetical protein